MKPHSKRMAAWLAQMDPGLRLHKAINGYWCWCEDCKPYGQPPADE